MTHDSIGVGEDGPTHQPIEHLMSFRVVPDLDVYRPCDAIEAAECWALAIENANGPSLIALSRQNVPQLRDDASENLSALGAYRLKAATAPRSPGGCLSCRCPSRRRADRVDRGRDDIRVGTLYRHPGAALWH
jgi:transketolase